MWNLNDYEDVQARKERFKKLYPNGSIISRPTFEDPVNGFITVLTEVRKDASTTWEDGSDLAHGNKAEYPKHLAKFYCEDTTTSSQGRALDLVIPSVTGKKPTKQDMEKTIQVEKPSDPWVTEAKPMPTQVKDDLIQTITDTLGAEEIARCIHGDMVLKEGVKNNKPWRGYICKLSGVGPGEQCPPRWQHLSKTTGKWVFN